MQPRLYTPARYTQHGCSVHTPPQLSPKPSHPALNLRTSTHPTLPERPLQRRCELDSPRHPLCQPSGRSPANPTASELPAITNKHSTTAGAPHGASQHASRSAARSKLPPLPAYRARAGGPPPPAARAQPRSFCTCENSSAWSRQSSTRACTQPSGGPAARSAMSAASAWPERASTASLALRMSAGQRSLAPSPAYTTRAYAQRRRSASSSWPCAPAPAAQRLPLRPSPAERASPPVTSRTCELGECLPPPKSSRHTNSSNPSSAS